MEVVFADNHLLVVYKPAGMLTQPSGTSAWSLEDEAKEWIRKDRCREGTVFLEAVHRIDKVTSGLVIFARTSKALARLQKAFRERRCHKTYHALVKGSLPAKSGSLRNHLIHASHHAKVVRPTIPGAKLAITHYRVLEDFAGTSFLELDLETGRYHQLRCQLAEQGCPIIGDVTYGASAARMNAIALQHHKISLPHPVGGDELTFEVPKGKDLRSRWCAT